MAVAKHKLLLIAVILLTIAMGVMIFIYPPSIFPDPSRGFQVMRLMQMGGGFNILTGPDQDDISQNTSLFLTWWSPGQYLIPYFFKSVFSINAGKASALTISIFELSGIAGFYFFFRKVGFSALIAAISIAFIACQMAFIIPYVFYNGGEILLFGFEGWFLYGLIALKKPGIKLVAFVLITGWAGFFFKSSFTWVYAAGILYLWLRLSDKSLKSYVKTGFWIAIPAFLSLAGIYIFFLSKGVNPASASLGLKVSCETFCFPLASPVLAGFSVDDLFQGLVNHPAHSYCVIVVILLLAVAVSLLIIVSIVYYVPNKQYGLLLIVFYTIGVLFFSMAYLRQLNISYEARHFRIIGLLIVPGVVYLISKFQTIYRVAFGLLCLGLTFASYSFLVKGFLFNKNISARGTSGIAQEYIDQSALDFLIKLDCAHRNAIFAFVTPDLGLEITHNRIITIDPPLPGEQIDMEDYIYDGHAGPLYLFLPANYKGADAGLLMKFFPGYSGFSATKLSGGAVLYSAR